MPAIQSLDRNGGLVPTSPERARAAELVTLPPSVVGKKCGTCFFFEPIHQGQGACVHPEVKMPVTDRQACKHWKHPGTFKTWQ